MVDAQFQPPPRAGIEAILDVDAAFLKVHFDVSPVGEDFHPGSFGDCIFCDLSGLGLVPLTDTCRRIVWSAAVVVGAVSAWRTGQRV